LQSREIQAFGGFPNAFFMRICLQSPKKRAKQAENYVAQDTPIQCASGRARRRASVALGLYFAFHAVKAIWMFSRIQIGGRRASPVAEPIVLLAKLSILETRPVYRTAISSLSAGRTRARSLRFYARLTKLLSALTYRTHCICHAFCARRVSKGCAESPI